MSTPEFASNELTVVSLFAGCGGSSLGYRMAGYHELLAVEWDKKACTTFRLNFPDVLVYEGDIVGLFSEEALRLADIAEGGLDLLDGSPPCQGFSTAGKRRFADGRNRLFEEYVRLLKAFRPKAFVMENVSGLVKGKMKLAFAEMTAALKVTGYKVSCRLLNAWWYGVPQDRRRLIWVGIREGLGMAPSHPKPTVNRPVTVKEACPWIDSLRYDPRGNVKGRYYDCVSEPAPTFTSGESVKGLQSYYYTVSCADDPHSPEELAPTKVPGRYAVSRAWHKIRRGNRLPDGYMYNLKLADPGKPCPTLAACWGEYLGLAAVMHPYECRRLTIREMKLLSGYPEWFITDGDYATDWRLIGNSVPPPMAEAIGRHVAGLLKGGTDG